MRNFIQAISEADIDDVATALFLAGLALWFLGAFS